MQKPLLLPLIFLTGAFAGCGTKTIDAAKGEAEISKAVRVQAGAEVKEVSCPTGVEIKQGATFTCKVTAKDGTSGDVLVTQKDDEGNVKFNAPFIHMDEAEAAIVEQIQAQVKDVGEVTVDCPDIVVGKPGAPFKCKGQAGTSVFVVNGIQTDGKGKFTFKTARP
jgi:hypothetical protein